MKNPRKKEPVKNRVGVHTSIAGGVSKSIERAYALKASTVQIFSHSPRQWNKTIIKDDEAELFSELRKQYDVNPAFVHASYLINLASLSESVLEKSIDLLSYELANADLIGAEYVVLHTGSAQGDDEDLAMDRAADSLRKSISAGDYRSSVILENTSGKKGDLTSSIKSLARIMEKCGSEKIAGICLDTCHAFSAGYDIRSDEGTERLFADINEFIGFDRVKLIHLNDSKGAMGSGVDRHEHIGQGQIGIKGFRNLLLNTEISSVPIVLETPKKSDGDDLKNLERVYDIFSGAI